MDESTASASTPEPVSTEDRLEAIFSKGENAADTAQVEDDQPEAEEEEQKASEDEDESETDEPEESTDEQVEEVEYEGKAYKLPKELKEALLRQKDYTQKTQEVAERRRAADQLAEQVRFQAEFQQAHFAKVVEVQGIDAQLQQYAQIDWAALAKEDPAQYLMLDRQQRTLQEQANRGKAEIQALAHEHAGKAQELRRQAQARCIEEVRKDIKDFSPEVLRSIDETGRNFGFSGEELAQVTDPRVVRVLHAAMQYQKLQGSKSIAEKRVQSVQPVKVKTAGSATVNQHSAKLNDIRARLKSTGRPADAEALLAARFAKSMR